MNNWRMVAHIPEINWNEHWQVAKITDMWKAVLCKYPCTSKPAFWLLYHDNVSANWSLLIQNCLTTNVTSVLPQPPCFLCLSSATNFSHQSRDTSYEQQKRSNTSSGGACRRRHAKQLSVAVEGLRVVWEWKGIDLKALHSITQSDYSLFTWVNIPNIPHITLTVCM